MRSPKRSSCSIHNRRCASTQSQRAIAAPGRVLAAVRSGPCYPKPMSWSRKLAKPIVLKDGRTIATLGDAREMMLSLPVLHRNGVMWQFTAEILKDAAADYFHGSHVDAEAAVALAEGRGADLGRWRGRSKIAPTARYVAISRLKVCRHELDSLA
jgi:hypothetical protein